MRAGLDLPRPDLCADLLRSRLVGIEYEGSVVDEIDTVCCS